MDLQQSISLDVKADREILKIPGVRSTNRGSYRIGNKIFIRLEQRNNITTYSFKLQKSDAALACNKYKFIEPMRFGKMGSKGWVDLQFSRYSQLRVLLRLLEQSRILFK